jgi:hypothetical protein
MPESFEQHFAETPEEKSPEQIKEEKALELARKIKEIQERMEKEGKTTIEGYQEIIELAQKIQKIYQEKEGPELFWDWKTKEKFLVDWQKDYREKFKKGVGIPQFSPDGEKIAAWIKDEKGQTIAVNGQTWEERFKSCGDPHFSPDGEKIAACIEDEKGETIAVNGQTWEERFGFCGNPYFSPDGEKIMVIVKKEGKYYRLVKEV